MIFEYLEEYEIDKANGALYEFFWDTFCSTWIEESKKESISLTLIKILNEIKGIINFIYIK